MVGLIVLLLAAFAHGPAAWAQDASPSAAAAEEEPASQKAEQDLAAKPAKSLAAEGISVGGAADGAPSLNLLILITMGGWLMAPILFMSVLVVAIGIERTLALRRSRIIPPQLIRGLGELTPGEGGFDPRKAYRLCQQYPSTAANVIRAMLLKVGRPHAEVEHAVADASEREAARLYGNVRTLNLAAAVTPLMGLLGTVWGMIQAFFATANMPVGANKAELLAEGIYVALVTTAGGLAVAIPAAVLAHIFEGRIQKMLLQIDELLINLLPHVERFEGKLRVSRRPLAEAQHPQAQEADDDAEETPKRPAATAK